MERMRTQSERDRTETNAPKCATAEFIVTASMMATANGSKYDDTSDETIREPISFRVNFYFYTQRRSRRRTALEPLLLSREMCARMRCKCERDHHPQ